MKRVNGRVSGEIFLCGFRFFFYFFIPPFLPPSSSSLPPNMYRSGRRYFFSAALVLKQNDIWNRLWRKQFLRLQLILYNKIF